MPSGLANHYTAPRPTLVLSISVNLLTSIALVNHCSPSVVVIPERPCDGNFIDPGTLDSDTNDSVSIVIQI